MKVIHFIYGDLNNAFLGRGGGIVYTHKIYSLLSDKLDVVIVSGYYKGAKREEIIDGVKYVRVGIGNSYLISRLSYIIGAIKYLFKERADIYIEAVSHYSPVFLPFFVKNKPVVIVFFDYIGKSFIKYKGILGIFPYISERLYMNVSKRCVVIAEKGKRIFNKCRSDIIYSGIDKNLFNIKPTEKNYILYLGRYDIYHKGLDILIKAFENVSKKHKDVQLILIGSGKDELKLKEMIENTDCRNQIKMLGFVSEKEKVKFISESLFICMPSRFEGFGIVAIESSACGKAVVGTQVEGLSEAIVHGETGLIVKPEDPDDLAKAMEKLLDNASLRQNLGKRGRKFAERFSWEASAERYYKMCETLVKNYRR